MLLGAIRRIGEAVIGSKSDLEILVDEQEKRFAREDKIFICIVDLQLNKWHLDIQDFSMDKIYEYLPGITSTTGLNYSPMVAIRLSPMDKNSKDFGTLSSTDVFNAQKINLLGRGVPSTSSLSKFFKWFDKNSSAVSSALYHQIKEQHTRESNGELRVIKGTPRFLVFAFSEGSTVVYPGSMPAFRELYLKVAGKDPEILKRAKPIVQVCSSCGKHLTIGVSLKNFSFFSIDQRGFSIGFDKKSNQALICHHCDNALKLGLKIFDGTLRFFAYKCKIGGEEVRVEHSMVPLVHDLATLEKLLLQIESLRSRHFDQKVKERIDELTSLKQALDKVDRSKRKSLIKEIKSKENWIEKMRKDGTLPHTKDFELVELLTELSDRGVPFMDFYFYEKREVSRIKKFLVDIVYGQKDSVREVVRQLKSVSRETGVETLRIQQLVTVFGSKWGTNIYASLIQCAPLSASDLYKAAHRAIRPTFKQSLIGSGREAYHAERKVRQSLDYLHFVIRLLSQMELLK